MDRILIRELLARCIIGVHPDERRDKQDVIINIALEADLSRACRSDDFGDAIDYSSIKKRVLQEVDGSSFFLIEALAERIARICLEPPGVLSATVSVDKPGALRFARSVAVEITRTRNDA